MSNTTPIHKLAKELDFDSKRILEACKTLNIYAKGSSKRLNLEEIDKIKKYFESGQNVANETIDLNVDKEVKNVVKLKTQKEIKSKYFSNRLIGKS